MAAARATPVLHAQQLHGIMVHVTRVFFSNADWPPSKIGRCFFPLCDVVSAILGHGEGMSTPAVVTLLPGLLKSLLHLAFLPSITSAIAHPEGGARHQPGTATAQ